ncbi:tetratricopeptide repeat protein, partial [Trichormus variabilis]
TRTAPEREVADKVQQIINDNIKLFVGRSEEINALDNFLSKNSNGIKLVIGGAGFGKTSLLANWIKSQENKKYFIAYHFFSQRYDVTRSIKNAYRHLLQQLYTYYDELTYQQLPNDEQQLRDRLIDLLQKYSARKDKPLVIILDSLDEAANPFEPPFPTHLPENVFVIVSARAEEGEKPEYLSDWIDNGEPIPLNRLPKEAIADWLKQSGEGELAIFADDIHFVKQLDEITQGFPLYLHFLVQELIQAQQLGQDVQTILQHSPKGFKDYVQKQFKQLAQVEEIRGHKEVRELFALLSVGLGAFSQDDILALTNLNEWDLVALPWQVTRWFSIQIGFYSFTHPLLAQEFQGVLRHQISSVKANLIQYCGRWQENQSRYALRYYAEHLRDHKLWEDLYAIARNKNFSSCQQEHLPDEPDLPLKTIHIALLSAAKEDKAGEMAEFLLLHAQQLIDTKSIESPLDALQTGSLTRALALADMYEIDSCILWYLLIVWDLKEKNREEEARKTLVKLQNKNNLHHLSDWAGEYAAYLLIYSCEISEVAFCVLQNQILDYRSQLTLCKNLIERGYLKTALNVAQSIDIKLDQKIALGEVAIGFAKIGDITTALNIIDDFQNQREVWLGKIAIGISLVGEFDKSLEIAQQLDTVERSKTLGVIANILAIEGNQRSQSIFNRAIQTALEITNQRQQIRTIWEICQSNAKNINKNATRLALDKALDITQEIKYQSKLELEYEIGEIAAVISLTGDYTKALELIKTIETETVKSSALVKIVKAVAQDKNFPLALEIANQISDSVEKTTALGKIVRAIARAGDFNTALDLLGQISNLAEHTWTTVDIAVIIAEAGDFTKALEVVDKILPADYTSKLIALVRIAIRAGSTGNKEYAIYIFKESLKMKSTIENNWEWQLNIGEISQAMSRKSLILASSVFPNIESTLTLTEKDFIPALRKAYESNQDLALIEVAERMAMAKLGKEAVNTAMMISNNNNFFLPRIAFILSQTGDKNNFKRLLIPCSYYMYAAYQMSVYLRNLYPEQLESIFQGICRVNQKLIHRNSRLFF